MEDWNRACVFYKAWQGECGKDPVPGTEPPLCSEHNGEECHVCGKQATTQCGNAGQFVCGYPLCETCECSNHGVTGHGSGRDFGQVEDDIVSSVVSDDYETRSAEGSVNDMEIIIRKYKHEYQGNSHPAVRVLTEDGESEEERFDDEDEADECFEMLVDRYDLVEIES